MGMAKLALKDKDFYIDDEYAAERMDYEKRMTKYAKKYGAKYTRAKKEMRKVLQFETQLAMVRF